MAVRLIALDLDGTALREHREMTERTREAILAALDAGMNDHVAKPINMNLLVPTIRKYL